MHILMVNSGRKAGNTVKVLKALCDNYEKQGHTTEILHLMSQKLNLCIGCESCIEKDYCHMDDDFEDIKKKLLKADALVLSSPVYMNQVSGRMKTLIDRTCSWFHRPALIGKPCLVVCTTKGSGLKNTVSYLEDTAVVWGMIVVGHITKNVRDDMTVLSEKEREVSNLLLHCEPKNYKPSLQTLIQYQVQKILAVKVAQIDLDYWTQRGWHESGFYYSCRITKTKGFVSKSFYKMLDKKIPSQLD